MKRTRLFSIPSLLIVFILAIFMAGCDTVNGPTIPPTETDNPLDFSIKDSASGLFFTTDTVFAGEPIIFIGSLSNGATAVRYQYNYGDLTLSPMYTNSSMMGPQKYLTSGFVATVVLDVWDVNNNHYQRTKQITIAGTSSNMLPVLKVGITQNLGNNTWKYQLLFLKKTIDTACSPGINTYDYRDTADGWVSNPVSSDSITAEGYIKVWVTKVNGQRSANTIYRNFPNCAARLAPNLPYWTNIFYNITSTKNVLEYNNGSIMVPGNPPPSYLPPGIGDSLNPVLRLGMNFARDTVNMYFGKSRANGTQQPICWNSISGYSTQLPLVDAPGYPDWWIYRLSVASIPVNTTVTTRYATAAGLANMNGSWFYNQPNNWLQFQVVMIGDAKVIVIEPCLATNWKKIELNTKTGSVTIY